MAAMKIAVSLDELPQMLKSIVLEALRREPDLQVLEHAERGAAQVLLSGPQSDPGAALLAHGVLRLIELQTDGQHAVVHTLRHERWTVDDPSPSRLVALLRDTHALTQGPQPRSLLRRLFAPAPSMPSTLPAPDASRASQPALPMPSASAPRSLEAAPAAAPRRDPLSLELARMAARILATRAADPRSTASELATLARELAAASDAAAQHEGLPGLKRAVQCFGLHDDERDLLLMAALVEADPRAARLMTLINDHMSRPRPTLGLVQDLGGQLDTMLERLVTNGPLLRLQLIALEGDGPLATRAVKAQEAVWPLLFGLRRLAPFTQLELRPDRLAGLALPQATRDECARAASAAAAHPASRLLLVVAGDAGVGRQSMAEAIAAHWRSAALVIEGARITDDGVVGALSREALWAHAVVIVTQAEAVPEALWRTLTERLEAPLIATAPGSALASLALHTTRAPIEVLAPRRDATHRLRLWLARAPSAWPHVALRDLAERYDFGAQHIDAALALTSTRAELREGADPSPPDARAACETLRETRFAGTAERIECPYEPGDIVLKADARRELDLAIAWARHAASLFGRDGPAAALRAGSGLACLFTGPPGGGKTMAAQILARQIDYALFRVDLSQVVDKFIGESEKRLAALFDEAERARVALFFDEADALFGKRTEVRDSHDRYANITVDYLLQRIEAFSGLAILATNFASNIDDAFLRRVRVRAVFPAPDAADRKRIWDKLLPLPEQRAGDIDLARLAEPFELMGGEIRNAIYTAHLLAAHEDKPLAMRHCVSGLWRELGKTGRICNMAQLGPWKFAVAA